MGPNSNTLPLCIHIFKFLRESFHKKIEKELLVIYKCNEDVGMERKVIVGETCVNGILRLSSSLYRL